MRERLIKLFATGLGAGYLPVAPGLAGSVVGLGYWWALGWLGNPWLWWTVWLATLAFAIWCAGAAAIAFGAKDPGCVVIDELIAVPLALLGLGAVGWEIAAAFVLFRVFDVWKPGPIGATQRWPGGWGIVADDLVAGGCACAATHGLRWAVERVTG